jgi:NADH-ubiquinone oxidoreductase chain 6
MAPMGAMSRLAIFIAVFVISSIILIFLDYAFMGLTYIIVYVGAISILILFVIMLIDDTTLNSKEKDGFARTYIGFIIIKVALISFILPLSLDYSDVYFYILPSGFTDFMYFTDINILGSLLFIYYPIVIIIMTLLLWLVLIGVLAIVSCMKL